jgi:hypothetical protein
MIEYIKDRWLTWRTGLPKQEREFQKWQDETIVFRATTIENMFMNFKYILPVSTNIFDLDEPFGWLPSDDFQQYLYPSRQLGDNTVYYFARGTRNQWDGRFHLDGCFGERDQVFVATNNSKDAFMIALKYSCPV